MGARSSTASSRRARVAGAEAARGGGARARRPRPPLARGAAPAPTCELEVEPGVELERRWVPLRSVGIYVPRGLVSTLVMCAVPAQAAGVERIVVVTPPGGRRARRRGGGGCSGSTRCGRSAAPQAIACARVRRDARRQDRRPRQRVRERGEARSSRATSRSTFRPARPRSSSSRRTRRRSARSPSSSSRRRPSTAPDAVCRVVEATTSRQRSPRSSARARAPRAARREAEALAPRVRNAGAVFVGASSPVAAGDYATGGNHVLPTGGWARAVGGLGLETFLKPVTMQRLTPAGLARVRPVVEALAAVEGMPAHAEAVRR